MENKIICQAINTGDQSGGRSYLYAYLIFLYSDGTWEKVFEYQWRDCLEKNRYNANRFRMRTREEALVKLYDAYSEGTIKGIFLV